jgi:uncharacterized NAD(P)/FAD-binding protein YdhS
VVEDLYEPGLGAALDAVAAARRAAEGPGALLIVGSNASALELLFHVSARSGLSGGFREIVCLSGSGALPRVKHDGSPGRDAFAHLDAALPGEGADGVFRAVVQDVARLKSQGLWPVDVLGPLSQALGRALSRLTPAEERRFHHLHGQAFSNLVRRAGPQYVSAAEDLERAGVLSRVQGEFSALYGDPASSGLLCLDYWPAGSTQLRRHPTRFVAAVNCTGGARLKAANPPQLLASLLASGQVALNGSGRGLSVTETFEACPNLFVMGPLLAGVFNKTLKTWHLENARRLYEASALMKTPLAKGLVRTGAEGRRAQRLVS